MSVYQARVDIAPRFGVGKELHGVPIFLATCIKQSINLNKTLRMPLWEARRVILGLSHAIGLKVLHESPSQKSVRKSVTVGSLVRCDSSFGAVSSPPLWYPTNVVQQAAKRKTAGAL